MYWTGFSRRGVAWSEEDMVTRSLGMDVVEVEVVGGFESLRAWSESCWTELSRRLVAKRRSGRIYLPRVFGDL